MSSKISFILMVFGHKQAKKSLKFSSAKTVFSK